MPEFLEEKLKQEYGADSTTPHKIMNARGYMRGNKITSKGEALQRKHEQDQRTAHHILNGLGAGVVTTR